MKKRTDIQDALPDVLALLEKGYSYREIADAINVKLMHPCAPSTIWKLIRREARKRQRINRTLKPFFDEHSKKGAPAIAPVKTPPSWLNATPVADDDLDFSVVDPTAKFRTNQ